MGSKRDFSDFRDPKEIGPLHWVIVFLIRRYNLRLFAEPVTLKIYMADL